MSIRSSSPLLLVLLLLIDTEFREAVRMTSLINIPFLKMARIGRTHPRPCRAQSVRTILLTEWLAGRIACSTRDPRNVHAAYSFIYSETLLLNSGSTVCAPSMMKGHGDFPRSSTEALRSVRSRDTYARSTLSKCHSKDGAARRADRSLILTA